MAHVGALACLQATVPRSTRIGTKVPSGRLWALGPCQSLHGWRVGGLRRSSSGRPSWSLLKVHGDRSEEPSPLVGPRARRPRDEAAQGTARQQCTGVDDLDWPNRRSACASRSASTTGLKAQARV